MAALPHTPRSTKPIVIGLLYGAISLLTAGLARRTGSRLLRLLVGWICFSTGAFACGYLVASGRMFGKTARGELPLLTKWLLLPVLFVVRLYNWQCRIRGHIEPMTEVRPGLWLSGLVRPRDLPLLRAHGIEAMLDVTVEFEPPIYPPDIHYLPLPLMDHAPPTDADFERAIAWLREQQAAGRTVLVHCALGQGRSVTILLAYLHALSPERSHAALLREIQVLRPKAAPNRAQMKALLAFQPAGG